jgi:MFS family permease
MCHVDLACDIKSTRYYLLIMFPRWCLQIVPYTQLETRGMSLVLGMWGWGFLISPVIAGALAEPVKQYPNVGWLLEGFLRHFLTRYPFLLPNMVGALLCLISIVFVKLFVTETLPAAKCRSARYIPWDIWAAFRGVKKSTEVSAYEECRPILPQIPSSCHRDSSTVVEHEEHDIEDAIRDSKMLFDEQVTMLAKSTATPHNSKAHSITKRTSLAADAHRVSAISEVSPEQPATISSLWADKTTRDHLILFWAFSSLTLAVDELFPLFCISKSGGLGLSENSIGTILSASGLIYATGQYVVYSFLIQWFGLYGSMRIGALLGSPIMALVPISLYLNRGQPHDALTWSAFEFLSILMAVYRICGLAFFSSIIVATNRTVSPSHLGTMNGLAGLGGSVANGIGPTFAGVLVAFSLSSGVFTPEVGAIFMFLVIGVLGSLGTVAVYLVLHDPNEEEDSVEMKS